MEDDKPNKQQFNYTTLEKIERIGRRLDRVNDPRNPLVPILKAILDLLKDELK